MKEPKIISGAVVIDALLREGLIKGDDSSGYSLTEAGAVNLETVLISLFERVIMQDKKIKLAKPYAEVLLAFTQLIIEECNGSSVIALVRYYRGTLL